MAPLANDPIMSERSMRSFRHLECQNPFIISDSIGRAMMVQQFWNRTERGRSTVVLEHLIIQAEVRSSRDHSKDKKYDLLTDKTNLHTQNLKK